MHVYGAHMVEIRYTNMILAYVAVPPIEMTLEINDIIVMRLRTRRLPCRVAEIIKSHRDSPRRIASNVSRRAVKCSFISHGEFATRGGRRQVTPQYRGNFITFTNLYGDRKTDCSVYVQV